MFTKYLSIIVAILCLACFTACFSGEALAAPSNKSITISGIVSDSITRDPVEAVTVSTSVAGTSYKAVTDNTGRYSLNISFNRKPVLIILVANKKNYLPSVKLLTDIQPGRSYTANFTMRDMTPPSRPVVTDDGEYLVASNSLHARWLSEDSESGIKEYRYSIGTRAGSADILRWTSAGASPEITLSNLNLRHGRAYFFNVRAINGVNLPSAVGSSDGITVNAHIPEITRIIPYSDTTMTVGDDVTIEVTAQDLDGDPVQYQFSIDGQVKQPFSSSNTFNYTVEPSTSNVHILKVEVNDDKNGSVSQEVTYNIQNVVIDTTPPPAPTLTTNPNSSSLDSIEAQWSSEDPESGIIEYQYAIGTTPGGTDVVYWTTYGNNSQAYLSGLNLAKGSQYYLSVVAKNGAGLKSPISTSPAITAQKEPYVKIYYPYQNAIIGGSSRVKGVFEGVNEVTLNGKTATLNNDGTFTGPYLVPPGYAKRNNITSDDPNYIIMNYPEETTITAQCAGNEDAVSFRYSAVEVKKSCEDISITTEYSAGVPGTTTETTIAEIWNYDLLTTVPFSGWEDESKDYRINYGSVWYYEDRGNPNTPPGYPRPDLYRPFELYKFKIDYGYATSDKARTSDWYIHTPPSTDEQIKPLVLVFNDCVFLETNPSVLESHPFDIASYKINGQSLKKFYGNLDLFVAPTPHYENACYVVLTDYVPGSDLRLDVETPFYPGSHAQQWFAFYSVDFLKIDAVREVPYGSGNYIPVNTIPIFQPDDGKGRGPSLELVNMPFLKLKFNEEPSGSQINTLEASMTIADEAKTFTLSETAIDSNIFTDPGNGVTIKFDSLPLFNANAQDELTCEVTSSFGSISDKLFNLKESASDSLYFNDIKTFVTLIFNSELLPYQQDSLTIQYKNGMMASEETLTETSADSLTFSNEDSTFTVNLNNYQGTLPDNLEITINNQDYLEISNLRLILLKTKSNPLKYSNYPRGGSSDLPANDPYATGQGIFRIQVKGLPRFLTTDILSELDVTVEGGIQEKSLAILEQPDSSYMTENLILLPEGVQASYAGVNSLISTQIDEWQVRMREEIRTFEKKLKVKSALIASSLDKVEDFGYNYKIDNVNSIFDQRLKYTTIIDYSLTKGEFLEQLPKRGVLYISGHGWTRNDIFTGFAVWENDDLENWVKITPSDVNGKDYKLVFLNGCLTADEKTTIPKEFKAAFDTNVYMGWKTVAAEPFTSDYAEEFFGKTAENSKETKKPKTAQEAYSELRRVFFGKTDKGIELWGENVSLDKTEDIGLKIVP